MTKEAPQFKTIVFSNSSDDTFVYNEVDDEIEAVKHQIINDGQVLFPSDNQITEYRVYDLGYKKFDDDEIDEAIEDAGRWTNYSALENALDTPIYDAWEVENEGREGFDCGFILFCKDKDNPGAFIYCADEQAESPFQCFSNVISADMTEVCRSDASYAVISFDVNLRGYMTDLISGLWNEDAPDEEKNQSSEIANLIFEYADLENKVLYLS